MEIIERITIRFALSATLLGAIEAILLCTSPVAKAQPTFALASDGCPIFYCNPEKTGLELGVLPVMDSEPLTITNPPADGMNEVGRSPISMSGEDSNIPEYTGCTPEGSDVDCVLQYPIDTANVSVLGFNVGLYSAPTGAFADLVAGVGENSTRIVSSMNFLQYVTDSGANDGTVAVTYYDLDSKSKRTLKPYMYTNILIFLM